MDYDPAMDKCRNFLSSQSSQWQKTGTDSPTSTLAPNPAVTLSRQTGAGGLVVGLKLAEYLQQKLPGPRCAWTVFDKNLVQKVLEDHHLPEHMEKFMPEDRAREIDSAVEELLGLHPSVWTLVEHSVDSIFRLAQAGNVILIGRGSHIITRHMTHVFHVRLIGSEARRSQHCIEYYGLDASQALAYVKNEDRKRRRYLKQYFDRDIEDPLQYHMILNTDLIPYDDAARIIGNEVLARAHS